MKPTIQLLALHEEFAPEFFAGSAGAFDRHANAGNAPTAVGVAVISVVGGLRNRSYYGFDMTTMRDAIAGAAADPKIKSIILDLDSPGGTVDGTPETALVIREAAKVKPVIAAVNTFAASAAYWLASQATKIVISPSGKVGSIGVFGTHIDFSKQIESDGVKITLVHAGKFKVEGNPYEPLTASAREEMQRSVDVAYSAFVKDVAIGRGVSVADVLSDFGQGRMVDAAEAVKKGMVDAIAPIEQVIASQVNSNTSAAGMKALDIW